jgi:hypothetical protein
VILDQRIVQRLGFLLFLLVVLHQLWRRAAPAAQRRSVPLYVCRLWLPLLMVEPSSRYLFLNWKFEISLRAKLFVKFRFETSSRQTKF